MPSFRVTASLRQLLAQPVLVFPDVVVLIRRGVVAEEAAARGPRRISSGLESATPMAPIRLRFTRMLTATDLR